MNNTKKQVIALLLYCVANMACFLANIIFGGSIIIGLLNLYTFVRLCLQIRAIVNPTGTN